MNPITVQVTVTGMIPQNFSAVMNSGTIAPGATYNFLVSNSLDMSQIGEYTFNATANAAGDGNVNNGAMPEVTRYADYTISSFPYFEDFENSNGNWRHESLGGVDDWEWGHPNNGGTYGITSANSGQNAWMTGLTSNYSNNAHAALMSPCVDMTLADVAGIHVLWQLCLRRQLRRLGS